ncbi:hypothetical protein JTB14_025330 [Gonioctena quinquepunctata]|nr:hypothetical protein JTB14_025330 [Gonioctena quinquepunctata]
MRKIWTTKKLLYVSKYQFHSYTPNADKTLAFVLKRLDQAPEPKDIKEALINEYKIPLIQVYRFSTRRVLYMVVTSKNYTSGWLAKNFKVLLYTVVEWDNRRNDKEVVHCHHLSNVGERRYNKVFKLWRESPGKLLKMPGLSAAPQLEGKCLVKGDRRETGQANSANSDQPLWSKRCEGRGQSE